jgi:hypothetical protein
MLPVNRWPRLLWKVVVMVFAPQRVAWLAEMRSERMLDIVNGLRGELQDAEARRNEQVNAVLTAAAQERRDARESHQSIVDAMKGQFDHAINLLDAERVKLTDESERLAESRQKVAVLEGTIEVKDTQIELQAATIAKFIEKEQGEARVHSLRGQRPEQEPTA